MASFYLIIISLILGKICSFSERFPKQTAQALNGFVLYISLPAIVILKVPELIQEFELSLKLLAPISMAWIMFLMSYFLFYTLGRKFKWSPGLTACLFLTAGLANTSFVGFPLLDAIIGPEAIKIALIADQMGTFLCFTTLGLMLANIYSKKGKQDTDGLRRLIIQNLKGIFFFPPFLVLMVTATLSLLSFHPPPIVNDVVTPLATTLGPLALFSVGFSLKVNPSTLLKYRLPLSLGLLFKLIIAPLIFTLIFNWLAHPSSLMIRVTILESAMATMITASVICNQFKLEEELANLMVGISIPLSLISVPIWNFLLTT